MCERFEWCDADDDPIALALLRSKPPRPARLTVVCPDRRHRLAAVYDLGDHGGLVFCRPASKQSLVHAWGRPGTDPNDLRPLDDMRSAFPHQYEHSHAQCIPVADLASTSSADNYVTLRCRCGSYRVDAPSISRLAAENRAPVITATRRR